MAMYWVPLPHHPAAVDEMLHVLWSPYYGAALVGDDGEIASLPRRGCRLEVLATAPSPRPDVDRVLPGQTLRHHRWLRCLDRFELPGGTVVGLRHLVGFRLRRASDTGGFVPSEDVILHRARLGPRLGIGAV